MAEQKSRIYSLPEVTEINDDMYLMLDASDTGARRFNLKTFYDKVDGVQASADAANTAATAAAAAVDSANQAAQQAASAAASASTTVQGLVDDVNEAIEAVGDVTELAVPTMSPTVKGGAKLGTGLEVTDGTLSVNTTASGDGSQSGPILSLSAKGWAEQDSTTGKNLLPDNANSMTTNGITFTKNSDGSVTVNGTATGAADFVMCGPTQINAVLSIGSVYTVSGTSGNISVQVWTSAYGAYKSTFTWRETSNCNYAIHVNEGETVSNVTVYPQLELGSTATAYEPYTGGAPSPSPDYPQEIRVARGRNLRDWPITQVYKDSSYTGSKNTYGLFDGEVGTLVDNDFAAGTQITYSFYANGHLVRAYLYFFDSSNNRIGTSGSSSTTRAYVTATIPAGTVKIAFGMAWGDSECLLTNPQLELGSTPHPYVPYGYVGLEEHSRKNLIKDVLYGKALSSDGTEITLDEWYASDFIPVEPNTMYALSGVSSMSRMWYTAERTFIRAGSTVTSPPNAAFVRINSQIVGYEHPQLEKGATPTDYEPYVLSTTPIPLPSRGWVASLPDGTADTLTLDGAGKVVWEKKTKEYVLDGSSDEGWGLMSSDYPCLYVTNNKPLADFDGDSTISNLNPTLLQKIRCSVGIGTWADSQTRNLDMAALTQSNMRIRNGHYNNDVAAFTAWLQSNPVTVLYATNTPVTEQLGYIENWPTDLPSGCQISIPELDDLNIRYHIDESVMEIARQWYERARSEYAEELAELRMTVSELATRVS